jgi:hypothetical protein
VNASFPSSVGAGGRGLRTAGAGLAFVAVSLVLGRLTQEPAHVRYVVALTAVIALLALGTRSPRLLVLGGVVWLTGLGLVRRLVSEVGLPSHLDPLLLVGPLILGLLVLAASRGGVFSNQTSLSRWVAALQLLILLGAINPLQGSLFGGIAGLLFVFVPTLGFWVGRALDDRTLRSIFAIVATLGVAAAVYGLLQTVAGFPSWDQDWIDQVSFASLNVNGVIRPFASFSSAQEYAEYLAVGIVVWVAMASRLRFIVPAAAALAVLIPAIVLESSRGAVVLLVVSLGAMLGARLRLPLAPAAALGLLLLLTLAFGLRHYGPAADGSSDSSALVAHDVAGLSDPLNPQNSTVGVHMSLVVDGIKSAFTNPVGRGIGTVTRAGSQFGGVSASTEADPSNAAVALGLPGLVSYFAVLVLGMRAAYGAARRRQDVLSLVALGIAAATILQWLNGGLYSVAFLPWLALGWADRSERESEST